MKTKELKDIFEQLEKDGWEPLLCDTPVPYYDNPVVCGIPTSSGDMCAESIFLPKELLSMHPEFTVTVKGESMKNAGIVTGDIVKIISDVTVYDGDIVLCSIDGQTTLKAYCEYDDGQPWLVPQNENFNPIPLAGKDNVWIIGKVKQLIKQAPRVDTLVCRQLIKKEVQKLPETPEISQQRISWAIREIAPFVTIGRQWFAVYRAMADLNVVREEDFDGFCQRICDEIPTHHPLPSRIEMQRMAIQSFARPLNKWDSHNAPVTGKRYTDYVAIAKKMKKMLEAA